MLPSCLFAAVRIAIASSCVGGSAESQWLMVATTHQVSTTASDKGMGKRRPVTRGNLGQRPNQASEVLQTGHLVGFKAHRMCGRGCMYDGGWAAGRTGLRGAGDGVRLTGHGHQTSPSVSDKTPGGGPEECGQLRICRVTKPAAVDRDADMDGVCAYTHTAPSNAKVPGRVYTVLTRRGMMG
jgi:hypothetical protein